MPADPSKDLVWTEPFSASSPSTSSAPSSPRKKKSSSSLSTSQPGDAPRIPRPPNAFILFRSAFIKSHTIPTNVEPNHSTLSKIIGLTWRGLSDPEKDIWHGKAKEVLDEHRRKWPGYAFRPTPSAALAGPSESSSSIPPAPKRPRGKRRKDEERCQHIASLLITGVKGTELDTAIQEFDESRPSPLETTIEFEEIMTESAFRTSSTGRVGRKKERKTSNLKKVKVIKESSPDPFDGMPELVERPAEMDWPQPAPLSNGFEFDSFSVGPSTPITPASFDAQHFQYPPQQQPQPSYYGGASYGDTSYTYNPQFDPNTFSFDMPSSSCFVDNSLSTPITPISPTFNMSSSTYPTFPDFSPCFPAEPLQQQQQQQQQHMTSCFPMAPQQQQQPSSCPSNSFVWPQPEIDYSTMTMKFDLSQMMQMNPSGFGSFNMPQPEQQQQLPMYGYQ